MTTHSFQCPACGAPLIFRENSKLINCPYCQMSVVVPESLQPIRDLAQWRTLVFDSFASNDNSWLVGNHTSEYFARLDQNIVEGRYRWNAEVSRSTSLSTAWLPGYSVDDFHLVVNCKHILGKKVDSSWGVVFRAQDNRNCYFFRITDSQLFAVSVVKDGQWREMIDWTITDTVKSYGVNQLEVIARGTHFSFLINGQVVHEDEDDSWARGFVGVAIEGYTVGEQTIFDFLDVLLRARY